MNDERRRLAVGSSEIASVMGLSPYEDPYTVWLKKTGRANEAPPVRADMTSRRWGRVHEPEILRAYCEVRECDIIRPGTLVHPSRPFQVATPDGIVAVPARPGLIAPRPVEPIVNVEAKSASLRMSHEWGDPDDPEERDRVPTEYWLQTAYASSVVGAERGDLPVLIDNADFRIYEIHPDKEIEAAMVDAAREFVDRYLIPDLPPDAGWTPEATEYIKRKFPAHRRPMIEATDVHFDLAVRLYALKWLEKRVEEAMTATQNRAKLIIGDAEGIDGGKWKLWWKKKKDSPKVDWEALAGSFRTALQMIAEAGRQGMTREEHRETIIKIADEALADEKSFTRIVPGSRAFGPHTLPDQIFWRYLDSAIKRLGYSQHEIARGEMEVSREF